MENFMKENTFQKHIREYKKTTKHNIYLNECGVLIDNHSIKHNLVFLDYVLDKNFLEDNKKYNERFNMLVNSLEMKPDLILSALIRIRNRNMNTKNTNINKYV